ncbi:Helix-turn-helix domain-containing protein [Saccharopolyspora antimicrobica]|uniref:Helix-turn-helix domain-containing protein n=1 Tax=Saccharopolyspora antimicrobica TaxID=455193 RepID=A0A1I5AVB2_9PSEU|nr:helix-turn-helix domain-containing protein [Saccharopolyspora antimicrobica]RKT86378.1 helix-turn-helix protein [Saccharopolyspora antimicrobica]SFN66383.1 Helix-turn-helix domain-containing protein [Saccharopolyspora antimicrobica]
MTERLSTAERDSIAAMLESVEPIRAVARRVGRHPDTVSEVLRTRPATQAVRAVAFRNRTIDIISLLLHGTSLRAAARAHGVSGNYVRGLIAPVRHRIAELQAMTRWDGEARSLLAVPCPHTEEVTSRFQHVQATVREVITAAERAEHHRIDDLLHGISLARSAPQHRPRARAFSPADRLRIRYLRDVEGLAWKDVARHFPGRSLNVLAVRYRRDKTVWNNPAPADAGDARGENR